VLVLHEYFLYEIAPHIVVYQQETQRNKVVLVCLLGHKRSLCPFLRIFHRLFVLAKPV
jgi:hypothetical protein